MPVPYRLCRCSVGGCKNHTDKDPQTGGDVIGQYILRQLWTTHQKAQQEADMLMQSESVENLLFVQTFSDVPITKEQSDNVTRSISLEIVNSTLHLFSCYSLAC